MSDLQFTIDRDAFADAVGWAARALSARPLNPILGGVRLSLDVAGLQVAAFDYEVSATATVKPGEAVGPGSTVVSGRLLQAITKALPRKPIEFRAEVGTVHVSCGAATFTLPTMNVGDFPDLPAPPGVAGEVDAAQLAEAIGQTLCAIHKGDGYGQLKSVCFDVADHNASALGKHGLTLTATDRYRVATRSIPWQPTIESDGAHPVRLLVPPRALGDIGRLGGDTVALGFDAEGDAHMLSFRSEAKCAITQLIGEEFPNVENLFPAEHSAVATVNAADLTDLLGRVLALDGRDNPHVHVEFDAGVARLSGGDPIVGEFREETPVELAGDPIDVWLNPKYLLEGLAACRSDKVVIGFTQPRKPLLLVPFDGETPVPHGSPFPALGGDFRYLLMPAQPPAGHR